MHERLLWLSAYAVAFLVGLPLLTFGLTGLLTWIDDHPDLPDRPSPPRPNHPRRSIPGAHVE